MRRMWSVASEGCGVWSGSVECGVWGGECDVWVGDSLTLLRSPEGMRSEAGDAHTGRNQRGSGPFTRSSLSSPCLSFFRLLPPREGEWAQRANEGGTWWNAARNTDAGNLTDSPPNAAPATKKRSVSRFTMLARICTCQCECASQKTRYYLSKVLHPPRKWAWTCPKGCAHLPRKKQIILRGRPKYCACHTKPFSTRFWHTSECHYMPPLPCKTTRKHLITTSFETFKNERLCSFPQARQRRNRKSSARYGMIYVKNKRGDKLSVVFASSAPVVLKSIIQTGLVSTGVGLPWDFCKASVDHSALSSPRCLGWAITQQHVRNAMSRTFHSGSGVE